MVSLLSWQHGVKPTRPSLPPPSLACTFCPAGRCTEYHHAKAARLQQPSQPYWAGKTQQAVGTVTLDACMVCGSGPCAGEIPSIWTTAAAVMTNDNRIVSIQKHPTLRGFRTARAKQCDWAEWPSANVTRLAVDMHRLGGAGWSETSGRDSVTLGTSTLAETCRVSVFLGSSQTATGR